MRVLVVGSGGREHALAWKLAQSPLLTKLYVAPGNPGTAQVAENVAIPVTDIPALVRFASENAVDLVVPGPDQVVVDGIADACAAAGIRCCAPTAAAAQLEGSKRFTKDVADEAGIPTAAWEAFTDKSAALEFVRRRGAPIVIKADGLAAGKGVVVAATLPEAEAAIETWIARGPVLIEECLTGPELSVFALCDGTDAVFMGAAQDYKRVGDGDTGPNTGGMGAISPPPTATPHLIEQVMDRVIRPALAVMQRRGTPFRGFLFAGLMLTKSGPKLIEFNARFGDPECQTLMPRLESDLLPVLVAACDGDLSRMELRWREVAAVTVIIAANGYPAAPQVGDVIAGIDTASALPNVQLFHAATVTDGVALRTSGGRVLALTATGLTIPDARTQAYRAAALINWGTEFYRSDIGSP